MTGGDGGGGIVNDEERSSHGSRHHLLGRLGTNPDFGPGVAERFWAKVAVSEDDCWTWTAYRSPKGYGVFGNKRAHRVAYEMLVGPIPARLTLDHLCRNRGCVRPDHLEPVTNEENILRGEAPSAKNARKTHCFRGHPLNGANLYVWPRNGMRVCVACRTARERARRLRRAEASQVPT